MSSLFGMSANADGARTKKTVTYGRLKHIPNRANKTVTPSSLAQTLAPSRTHGPTNPTAEPKVVSVPAASSVNGGKVLAGGPRTSQGRLTPVKHKSPREPDGFDVPSSEDETDQKLVSSKISTRRSSPLPSHERSGGRSMNGDETPVKRRKVSAFDASLELKVKSMTTAGVSNPRRKRIDAESSGGVAAGGQQAHSYSGSMAPGKSAPARLSSTVTEDNTSNSRALGTPDDHALRTPTAAKKRQPPSVHKSASLTPKQSSLWNQLLEPASATRSVSPSSPVRGARRDQKYKSNHPQMFPAAAEHSRQRMADRLKQDIMVGADDTFLSEDDDSSDEDTSKVHVSSRIPDKSISSSQALENSQSGPRYTYAQSRSYLQETSFEDSLLQPLAEIPADPAISIVHSADTDSDEEPSQGIRSVHELRAAGNRKRFLDDVETLVDEARDQSRLAWSKRRSALMELSEKFRDGSFAQRFMQSEFALVILEQCKIFKPRDLISDSILSILLIQMTGVDMSKHQYDGLGQPGLLTWLSSQLSEKKSMPGLAKDRTSNMSQASQITFGEFLESAQNNNVADIDFLKISAGHIALVALERVARKLRTSGNRQPLLDGPTHMILADGLHDLATQTTEGASRMARTLSILEADSLAITMQSFHPAQAWSQTAIKSLVDVLGAIFAAPSADSRHLATLLRLMLNLTNNQPANCTAFARSTVVPRLLSRIALLLSHPEALTHDEESLDSLLLCLGLAINIAEHSEAVRRAAASEEMILLRLAQIFVKGEESSSQAQSLEQSRTNVAFGYLAVLLANLCLDERIARLIKAEMPGRDISSLLRVVEEFISYHKRVDSSEGNVEQESGQAWTAFTERLGAVLDRVRDH